MSGTGPWNARPPAGRPPVRWSPLAHSVVIGICAASAALWVIVIATLVMVAGNVLHTQAEIMLKLGEITACPAEGAAA